MPSTTRLKASAIHLLCSITIAALAMAVIYWVWHPGAIAKLQGVDFLVLVLIGVDVTLGPLMTLIVFHPQKARHLIRLDLSIIALLQISALIYGLHSIYVSRPVYVVFNVDRFTILSPGELDEKSLQRAREAGLPGTPITRPRIVAARMPTDLEARNDILFSAIDGGADLAQMPEYYLPYEASQDRALERLRDLAELKRSNALEDEEWQRVLASLPLPADALGYLPVEANSREGVAILRRADGALLELRALYPKWD